MSSSNLGALKLPTTERKWYEMVSEYQEDVSNIHDLEVITSASKIYKGQFLSLRVLWRLRAPQLDFRQYGMTIEYEAARQFLRSLNSWEKYLKDIESRSSNEAGVFPDLGTFTLVRDHQLEAVQVREADDTSNVEFSPIAHRTRNKTDMSQGIEASPLFGKGKEPEDLESRFKDLGASLEDLDIGASESSSSVDFGQSPVGREEATILFPATRDEQIVNTALLLFLRAVSIHKLRNPQWTLYRRIFKVLFPKGKLEARTDGFLELNSGGESKVKAIVEVKAAAREGNEQIRMQESAQMAAWIVSEPDNFAGPKETKQRLLVSQNRHEIFLTLATYDQDYLSYLQGNSAQKSFMKMTEHGPYDVQNQTHMRKLGQIVLGFTMAAKS